MTQQSPRLSSLFIGNESLTVECAKMWLDTGHQIAAVVTRNDDVRGWAEGLGLRVERPGPDLASRLEGVSVDWLFSVAYLSLIPSEVLALATNGGINFHDGPLPKYAGLNAPVWALINGERSHGITWHAITDGVDEGDILVQRLFDLSPTDTALTLNTRCFETAIDSFPAVIDAVQSDAPSWQAQDLSARTHFARADRPAQGGFLDFNKPSGDIAQLVRALDHGTYWNPLTCAKITSNGEVWLVGAAESVSTSSGGATPGEVLAVEQDQIEVATLTGAIRLQNVRDHFGQIPQTMPSVGDILALPKAEVIRNSATIARHDPFWRNTMRQMHPAKLHFGPMSSDTGVDQIEIDTSAANAVILPYVCGLWALRASGEEYADIAWQTAETAILAHPHIISGWVPVRITDQKDQSLLAAADKHAETLAKLAQRESFACDLIARDPQIEPAAPEIGVRLDGQVDLIAGTKVTLALHSKRAILSYDRASVCPDMAQHLAERLRALLAAEPMTMLGDLPTMGQKERDAVLNGFNRTGKPYDIACVHALFETQCARTPDATAVVFEGQNTSYADLNARANKAAHVLMEMGVKPGSLVGLCTRRSMDMLVGALAILKAGGAYVPMDPAYPADRLALYAEDSGAQVIVTQSTLTDSLPSTSAQLLELDRDVRLSAAPDSNPDAGTAPNDLAYMIYTSGSTGRPKGVMVEHRNVANFFAGMDDRIDHSNGSVWLAVTSLNFDISVLELFWTLARGFKLVLSSDENRALVSSGQLPKATGGMQFSLFYWGNDDGVGRDKYRLLLDGAKFADKNGFCAVWTPERHFHAFGGPYPNPSVTGAAVAAVTENLSVRAGSCVAPLHHTARIAEEWAVIDNLTNGRAALAIASGWQPDDFVLRPENTPPQNKPAMYDAIRDLRALWKGEQVEFAKADGTMHSVLTQPRPVSADLPIWVTTAGNPETWREAGEIGANVLTHLLGQSVDEVADKIKIYHQALRDAGRDPADHTVTLMLHSYVAETRAIARDVAREPMKDYLRAAAGLIKQYAWAFPAFKKPKGVENPFQIDLETLTDDEMDGILDFAFQRYFEDSGLFGTVQDCVDKVDALKSIGVDEIACLIDYGISVDQVLEGLKPLAQVLTLSNQDAVIPETDFSIAAQILRHKVTHLQCTPSMARMIAMNDEARHALSTVKHLMLGGEALPGALVQEFQTITEAHIENMYGPTETTIWSSTTAAAAVAGTVDIGTPIANTQLYVLDETLAPLPIGVAGELWIGGDGVTRGYWQRQDLTKDRFRADPFHGRGRMYGTGDLVRRRADGRIDFLGRADHQVKLRGYRIELGEVEAALEAQPDVEQAVVLAREDRPGDIRLVGYIRGKADHAVLKRALAINLPAHMVPTHIQTLDAFPLTPNRKVDRKALPAPTSAKPAAAEAKPVQTPAPNTPTGDVVATIAEIWQRVLGVSGVNARSNFFELGGHSLLAVQAHREIKAALGATKLSITDIFRFPTLGALADQIGGAEEPQKKTPVARTIARHPVPNVATPSDVPQPAAANDRAAARNDAMARRRAMRAARR